MSRKPRTSEELRAKIDALKKEEAEARARERKEKEKEDARRKETIGAIVEAVYGKPLQEEQIPRFRSFLEGQEKRGQWLSKNLDAAEETTQEENS